MCQGSLTTFPSAAVCGDYCRIFDLAQGLIDERCQFPHPALVLNQWIEQTGARGKRMKLVVNNERTVPCFWVRAGEGERR